MSTNNIINDSSNLMQLSDGSAVSPTYTFSSDLTTGLYRSSSGVISGSSSGSEVIRINSKGITTVINQPIIKILSTAHNATGTALGSELFGGVITCAPVGAITLTFDTATNIYSAMGSPGFSGAAFICKVVVTSGVVTVAGNTGLTLTVGTTTISADAREYIFVVNNPATPTFNVYGG